MSRRGIDLPRAVRPPRPWITAAALVLLPLGRAAAQCAMCKANLEGDAAANAGFTMGVFWTVLLFLGVLFSLAGGIVYQAFRSAAGSSSG